MSFSNQYIVSAFPYHRDGVWHFDNLDDDQFDSPENFTGGAEDQFFLPLVPGRIYRIKYICEPQVILTQPPGVGPQTIRFELIAWHDLDLFAEYMHLFCEGNPPDSTVPAFGFLQPPFPGSFGLDIHAGDVGYVDESVDAFPSVDWTIGGPDQNGNSTPDPATTRLSVAAVENPALYNLDLLPIAYTLDISIANGGSRYRPISRG